MKDHQVDQDLNHNFHGHKKMIQDQEAENELEIFNLVVIDLFQRQLILRTIKEI